MWAARVNMIFPLAAHLGGMSQHWLILANFWAGSRSKVHKLVTLWVWKIIECEKRKKIPNEVLYQVQKCFSPGVPYWGIFPILGTILRIYPNMERQGKTILNLIEDLIRYLLAFLAPNYLSHSQSYEFMNFTSQPGSEIGQNQSMLRNTP